MNRSPHLGAMQSPVEQGALLVFPAVVDQRAALLVSRLAAPLSNASSAMLPPPSTAQFQISTRVFKRSRASDQ
jgi:hypothetical protein